MPEAGRGAASGDCSAFVRELRFDALPADVVAQAKRCLRDLAGVAAAGSTTAAATIANAYAASQLRGDPSARLLFDGRHAGIAGAAFAGAATIDSIDAHDGHVLTKGHAGVAILPALLALVDTNAAPDGHAVDGREFVTCIALGYEVATRAGIALHRSVADYHCSGAWNALGCAAITARIFALDRERVRHALGIAEYFGPRGQILRACEVPTMVKDGSAFGAHVGVTAAWLAREGFTGAPAVTVERANEWWSDLGSRWRIREQYFKPYPVCRWAQPAIEAALALRREHEVDADSIVGIEIASFREAVALGAGRVFPATTEDAQYSIRYPVAASLVFGRIGVDELAPAALADERVHRLIAATTLREDAALSARFPQERWARVVVTLADGRTLESAPTRTRGDFDTPLEDAALHDKYRALADPVLGAERASRIEALVDALVDERAALAALVDELLSPAAASD